MCRSLCNAEKRPSRARSVHAVMAGVLLVGAVLGTTAPAAAAAAACWDNAITDVDGGGLDAILGLPSYDLPGKPDAGAIVVFSNVASDGESDPSTPTNGPPDPYRR